MSHHHPPRRILPVASRKRKETDPFYSNEPPTSTKSDAPNRLLAGYMAHEFLTTGTLFGQEFDPARVGAVPLTGASAYPRRVKLEAEPNPKEHRSYAEVTSILKTGEAHIPGITNPTQLARWIQM